MVNFTPITFNPKICNGCNICIEVCQVDLFLPNPEKGRPPSVIYPEECWFEGSCVESCPKPGAMVLNRLDKNRIHWRNKNSGEDFWF